MALEPLQTKPAKLTGNPDLPSIKATTTLGELWINVKRVEGEWKIAGTKPLTDFEADWAPGQPADGADCAYMDKARASFLGTFDSSLGSILRSSAYSVPGLL